MPKRKRSSMSTYLTNAQKKRREAKRTYVVSGIRDFRVSPVYNEEVEILCAWEGYTEADNCWVWFQELRPNQMLRDFVNDKFKEFEISIYVMTANIKQRIKDKIRHTLRTKTPPEIALEVMPFDEYEYKVLQVGYYVTKEKTAAMLKHLETLIYKNFFYQLEKTQKMKHDELVKDIKKIENIKFTIENFEDFDILNDFNYIRRNVISEASFPVEIKKEGKGCCCKKCTFNSDCCAKLMNEPFAYAKDSLLKITNRLIDSDIIIECGEFCLCSRKCRNRVTQRVSPINFVLFKTISKGWGVKTVDSIKAGSYIFEYRGELLTIKESEERNSRYMMDIIQTDYTIDAGTYGNLAKYVNHACDPNAYMWTVYNCDKNVKNVRLCMFASRDIKAGDEITIDYSPKNNSTKKELTDNILNQSHSSFFEENECFCGTSKCRGKIF